MRFIYILSVILCSISLLARDNYFKIYVDKPGFYKIYGYELEDLGAVISLINPATIQIFSDGQRILPYSTTDPVPQLNEIAIIVHDGNDNNFDQNDFILFYGESINRFEWDNSQNEYMFIKSPYDSLSCYWIK